MGPSLLSDLFVRACSRVTKNSTRGQRPSALFLVTRLQANTDKSDNTWRNHTLIVLSYFFKDLPAKKPWTHTQVYRGLSHREDVRVFVAALWQLRSGLNEDCGATETFFFSGMSLLTVEKHKMAARTAFAMHILSHNSPLVACTQLHTRNVEHAQ